MKFNRIFYKSDDFITAIDLHPSNQNLVCCANYSGRLFLYDYEKKSQVVENRLKLQKRRSSTSDIETIGIPHVTTIAFSPDALHLMCGLENGTLILLDPIVLHELHCIHLNRQPIAAIKFSPDSSFVTLYVRNSIDVGFYYKFVLFFDSKDQTSTVSLLHHDKTLLGDEWKVLGKVRYHTKAICDVLFIPPSSTSTHLSCQHKVCPRLISLAQDRVSFCLPSDL